MLLFCFFLNILLYNFIKAVQNPDKKISFFLPSSTIYFALAIILRIIVGPPTCADGWTSMSIGKQGACSHHGGVDAHDWIYFVSLVISNIATYYFFYFKMKIIENLQNQKMACRNSRILSKIIMHTLYRPFDTTNFLKLLDIYLKYKTLYWSKNDTTDISIQQELKKETPNVGLLICKQNNFLSAPYWNANWIFSRQKKFESWPSIYEIWLQEQILLSEIQLYKLAKQKGLYRVDLKYPNDELYTLVGVKLQPSFLCSHKYLTKAEYIHRIRCIYYECSKKYNLCASGNNIYFEITIHQDEKYLYALNQEIRRFSLQLTGNK